jgi:hypothetical protein
MRPTGSQLDVTTGEQVELTWPSLFRRTLRITPKDPCPSRVNTSLIWGELSATDLSSLAPRTSLPQTYSEAMCLVAGANGRNQQLPESHGGLRAHWRYHKEQRCGGGASETPRVACSRCCVNNIALATQPRTLREPHNT